VTSRPLTEVLSLREMNRRTLSNVEVIEVRDQRVSDGEVEGNVPLKGTMNEPFM
jgi:hypothetical protein